MSRFDETKARNESAALVSGACNPNGSNDETKRTRKPTKLKRMAAEFTKRDYLDFQRAGKIGDSCLNTTVSILKRHHGIEFDITDQTVCGWSGHPTRCAKYTLKRTPENLARVRAFLGLPNEATE